MCEFCKRFDFSTARAAVDKYSAKLETAMGTNCFPEADQFNFCPVCGAILPKKSHLEEKAKFAIWDVACQVLRGLEEIAHDCDREPNWAIGTFKESFDMALQERECEVD